MMQPSAQAQAWMTHAQTETHYLTPIQLAEDAAEMLEIQDPQTPGTVPDWLYELAATLFA
jgi:hypothetical protein